MNSIVRKRNVNWMEQIEFFYLCILAIFFVRRWLNVSMFQLSYPAYFDKVFRTVLFLVLLLKIGCCDAYKKRKWLLCVLMGSTFIFSWISNGYEILLDISLLLIGSMEVDAKKILKVYVVGSLSVLSIIMLGSFTGSIEDLLYTGSSNIYRHSFGVNYPTDFAARLVYLFLVAMVLYGQICKPLWIAGAIILAGFVYQFSHAKCSTIVFLLTSIGLLLLWIGERWKRNSEKLLSFKRILRFCFIFVIPCCAVLMCGLMVVYNPEQPVLSWLNTAITGRLRLAKDAFLQYGIHAFGSKFVMIGAGFSTVGHTGYNFIDSSYCLILVRYGFFVFLAVCIYGMRVSYAAEKNQNDRLLLAIGLMALHSMIEHHLLDLEYNVFFLLSFADFKPLAGNEKKLVEKTKRIRNQKTLGILAVGILLGVFLFPSIISYGRTIVSILRLYETVRHKYFLVAMVIVLLFIYLLIYLAWRTLGQWKSEKCFSRKYQLAWCAEILFALLLLAGGETILSKGEARYASVIETEQEIMEMLSADPLFDGKIYVDDFPTIYRRTGMKFLQKIFPGESLCAQSGVVLFTQNTSEWRRLCEQNFYFGELSDQTCVYTNHPRAIELLKKQGIPMTDYYSVKKQVDLFYLASANGLPLSEEGGLLVDGPKKSLIHGPYLVLYRGKYAVRYTLQLLEAPENAETLVTVRVAGNAGQIIYKEEMIDRSMFDENGTCVYTVETNIGNVDGVEFLLFAKDGVSMEITDIEYGKIGRAE